MKELLLIGSGLVVTILAFLGAKILTGSDDTVTKLEASEKEVEARKEVTRTLIEKAKISAKTDSKVKELEEIEKMPDSPEKLKAAADAIADL